MYWTLELASKLEDAPWPASKDELIDFAIRSGAPLKCLSEKIFEMCFPVVISYAVHFELYIDL